jgi:hypothetical protein
LVSEARTAAAALLTAAAVRERCAIVFAAAEGDAARHFRLVPQGLDEAASRVAAVTRRRYPDLEVPLHSRWRHFSAGGIDRAALVATGADAAERARARIDLAVVSVLLDAGGGPDWGYREAESGALFDRSEGLAVASLRAMQQGLFSADPKNPWRADAKALGSLTPARLAIAFQHGPGNALPGLDRRALLLRRVAEVCTADRARFGPAARPGGLYDYWRERGDTLAADELLHTLLVAFGPIWPSGTRLGGVPLGDCWRHPAVPGDRLVPFHKLSQWLAYSLVEPLASAGVAVVELGALTGLAEYRNGGLFLDCGAIEPRDLRLPLRPLSPRSEPVVEWRALTVILLDRLAEKVRQLLGKEAAEFPLARVLEGGSWAAGRETALERRPNGVSPLAIRGDGTLF